MPEPIRYIDLDCQVGLLVDAPVDTATPTDLLARHRALGVAAAACCATSAWWHDPASGNAETHRLTGGRLRPTVMLHPPMPGRPSVTAEPVWADAVLATAAPRRHGWSLDEPSAGAVLDALVDLRRPLLLSVDDASWAELDRLAGARPDLVVLVTDIGYRALRRLAPILQRRPNLHALTANFATHEGIEWFVEHLGVERLLFGSGSPRHDLGAAVARLQWSGLPDADVRQVAHDNAVRLVPAFASAAATTSAATGPGPAVRQEASR